jgi:hypothetical protein
MARKRYSGRLTTTGGCANECGSQPPALEREPDLLNARWRRIHLIDGPSVQLTRRIADPTDVDQMMKLNLGTTYGPFELMDMVGLDVVLDIEKHHIAENPRLPTETIELLRRYVDIHLVSARYLACLVVASVFISVTR